MKVSCNYLKEVLGPAFQAEPEELSSILLNLGFEVASIERSSPVTGVVAAEVLAAGKHPNADRLRIVKVTDGKETAEVVCGAPNVEPGMKAFWAKTGATLAGGEKVKSSAIRGVNSPGMLCSLKELGIAEDHSGLWKLDADTPLGAAFEQAVGGDVILDLEITPNRPDGLSMIGIARELSAYFSLPLPAFTLEAAPSLPAYPIEIEPGSGGFRYVGRKFESVTVAPSPLKVQAALLRLGIRPINNIVDITNLVMLETGQPLHAFDADKLEGGRIAVRRARAGEKILALDGRTYALDPEILVIADAGKPVAIAGIMGGEESAVGSSTRNVLLESAIFDRRVVRRGKNKLGLASESSYRFERGVSRWSCAAGSALAGQRIKESAGGMLRAFADVALSPESSPEAAEALKAPRVSVRAAQTSKTLGLSVAAEEIASLLKRLGVPVLSAGGEKVEAQSPEWRLDLNQEIDFIEEIARLKGYGAIPLAGKEVRLAAGQKRAGPAPLEKIALFLRGAGFNEAVNYGLVSQELAAVCIEPEKAIPLANPLSEEQQILRPSLLLELLKNVRQNLAYRKKDIRLFESGRVFRKEGDSLSESNSLAAAACGALLPESWQNKEPPAVDFFWMKGVVEEILKTAHLDNFVFVPGKAGALFHPAFCLDIQAAKGGRKLGCLGAVHPRLRKSLELEQETFLFEIDLDALMGSAGKEGKAAPVLRTPAVERDCSIWLAESHRWGEVAAEIRRAGGELLAGCSLFDLYRDKEHAGLKSLSFTLTFRHPEATLKDEEANALRDRIIEKLRQKFKAELRSK